MLALIGHFVKSYFDERTRKKEAEIERLTLQIEKFFGPIDGCLLRARAGFSALINHYRSTSEKTHRAESNDFYVREFFNELSVLEGSNGSRGNKDILNMWMDYVKEIAYPVNKEIRDTMASQAHLYDGTYPEAFETIFDLVAEREMMLKAWGREDFSVLQGAVKFPDEADMLVKGLLQRKQARKAELLRMKLQSDEEMHEEISSTTDKHRQKRTSFKHYTANMQDEKNPYSALPLAEATVSLSSDD